MSIDELLKQTTPRPWRAVNGMDRWRVESADFLICAMSDNGRSGELDAELICLAVNAFCTQKESQTFEVRQTGWVCPQCGHALKPVTYHGGAMALNREQWESVRAGDWYCEKCKSDASKTGYKYYWNHELTGDGSRREAERPSSIGLSVASPASKDWPVQCVHHVPIPADGEHPCPVCKATQPPPPPPVSNEFVAEGCEQFTAPQIDALTAVAREILKWENATMIPGYRLIEIVEMARKAIK